MLRFSTVLDIKPEMTPEEFRKLVVEWNDSASHEENKIPGLSWNGEKSLRCGSDGLWLAAEEYEEKGIIAVRYEKKKADGIIWDTDYVVHFEQKKIAIRLEQSYTEDAASLSDEFSAPFFISHLIRKNFLADDGALPISNRSIPINKDNAQLLADIVNGTTRYKIPVVYISRTPYDNTLVDPDTMASHLKGIAHVLVQESQDSNDLIRELCDSKNVYNGTIAIYYPNQNATKKILYSQKVQEGDYDDFLFDRVKQKVLGYNNKQVRDPLYTWQGVVSAKMQSNLDALGEQRQAALLAKQKAEEEFRKMQETFDEEQKRVTSEAYETAEALVKAVEEENQNLKDSNERYANENAALQCEIDGLRRKMEGVGGMPVLFMGAEKDIFQGEIRDIILSALTDALPLLHDDCRRRDVLEDILKSNDYEKAVETKRNDLKRVITTYTGMTAKVRSDLTAIGFEITEDGKHYKLRYGGDTRYQFALAKTPSDKSHGSKNAFSEMANKIF